MRRRLRRLSKYGPDALVLAAIALIAVGLGGFDPRLGVIALGVMLWAVVGLGAGAGEETEG